MKLDAEVFETVVNLTERVEVVVQFQTAQEGSAHGERWSEVASYVEGEQLMTATQAAEHYVRVSAWDDKFYRLARRTTVITSVVTTEVVR